MSGKRSYHQFCGLARALDVVGERWTLLLVRDLLLGPRRYTDLLQAMPGLTTNLLAERLQALEEGGLVERRARGVYALTDAGAALEPAIMELARWGGRYLDAPREDDRVDVGWALLSLKRRYRPVERERVVEIRSSGRVFELVLGRERLGVRERDAMYPQVVVAGELPGLRALLWGLVPPDQARREGLVAVTGDDAALADLVSAFAPSVS